MVVLVQELLFRTMLFVIFVANLILFAEADESQFGINGYKVTQVLSDKFLSVSVDPAIFFSDLMLNDRDVTLNLMKHLTPAYLRISGPSTPFLRFSVDKGKPSKVISGNEDALVFNPAMWWALNEFVQLSKLSPVFAISDPANETHELAALLDMTAKMNVDCVWQIGQDCSLKGFDRYKLDIGTLRQLINGIPDKRDKWKIAGSDLSKCRPSDYPEILRMYLADLKGADAIVWNSDSLSSPDTMQKLLNFHQASIPVWLSLPKSENPVDFQEGLLWAYEVGQAAKAGFNVVFREPRIQEFYSPTPVYWASVLFKKLMGRNVLDVNMLPASDSTSIYAHCTRDQNSYAIRGAMTVMIVNNASREHKTSFRLPTQIKSIEVRSYMLSAGQDPMDTLLNGRPLLLDNFELEPQLRRAKVVTHLVLEAPPKSIGFFVLPGAKIDVCAQQEDDSDLILQEIDKAQSIDFSGAEPFDLSSRFLIGKASSKLLQVQRRIANELKRDSIFMPKSKLKSKAADSNKALKLFNREGNKQFSDTTNKQHALNVLKSMRGKQWNDENFANPRLEVQANNFKKLFKNRENEIVAKPKIDLQLTSSEVLQILNERAQKKADRRLSWTDFDSGLFEKLRKLRSRRAPDINLDMLEKKVRELNKNPNNDQYVEGLPDMSKILPTSKPSLFGGSKQRKEFSLPPLLTLLTTNAPTTSATVENHHKSKHNKEFYEDLDVFGVKPQNEARNDLDWDVDVDFMNNDFIFKHQSAEEQDAGKAIERIENYFNENFNNFDDVDAFDLFKLKKRHSSQRDEKYAESATKSAHNNRKHDLSFDAILKAESNNDLESFKGNGKDQNKGHVKLQDNLKLPKERRIIALGQRNEGISSDDIPIREHDGTKQWQRQRRRRLINSRNARHVAGEISSIENAIDDFLDTKKEKFIKPSLLLSNKDLTFVFPIKSVKAAGAEKQFPEAKLGKGEKDVESEKEEKGAKKKEEKGNYGVPEMEDIIADSTCPATYPSTSETVTVTEDHDNAGVVDDDVSEESTTFPAADARDKGGDKKEDVAASYRQSRSQHIQKIPKDNGADVPDSTKYQVVIKAVMNSVKRLVRKFQDNFNYLMNTPNS